MIPEPTDEDFARDADAVYAEAWRLFQLGVGRKEPEALAWIRMTVSLRAERDRLLAVIREVHGQYADDLCWMDIDKIFAAAGLPVPDRRVGDKAAMLANCSRFIEAMCQGGKWPSYKELESERDRLAAENAELRKYIACRSVETFNDSPSMQREKP